MLNVYVGYDSRLDEVYNVCKYSIERRSNVNVIPIVQQELRNQNIYCRDVDTEGSTEFTLTRFLVPYLNKFTGWAIFCDCDFLFTIDVNEVFSKVDNQYAVMVVKHNYVPKTPFKMDNRRNYILPRKNWSSFILYNCAHPSNKVLSPDLVNRETPSYLHRFQWLSDDLIGELSIEYNWLVGYYNETSVLKPKIIHYTDGGPWFANYKDVEYSEIWNTEYELYRRGQQL